MESEWEIDRIRLFQLRRTHPDWTLRQLAVNLNRSLSWVKKWLKRFRAAGKPSLVMFKSLSRAPHHRPRRLVQEVREAILRLRDELKEQYHRTVGAKTILYHLPQDVQLQAQGVYLPRAAKTIWQVLKQAGRIPTRLHHHEPLPRPAPMQHWEMDFGQLGEAFEFLTVMDRGTSILVDTQTQPHYNAQTALLAVAQLFIMMGLPQKLRFDNDPRFVGSWLADGYPSPLMRFLHCLGVVPDLVQPGKPQHKPYAERSVRTLKHECLWEARPEDWLDAAGILEVYRQFYNHDRANQSSACGNRPPYAAFPTLPTLPNVPDRIDPDAWLSHYHQRIFRRRVGQNGMIAVGRYEYYVGYDYAREKVGVLLNANDCVFNVIHQGKVIRQLEVQGLVSGELSFSDYLKLMLTEASTTA